MTLITAACAGAEVNINEAFYGLCNYRTTIADTEEEKKKRKKESGALLRQRGIIGMQNQLNHWTGTPVLGSK